MTSNLEPKLIHTISNAATTLATLDHYLKLGTIADRKMAAEARKSCDALQKVIDQDLARRQMQAL